MLAELDTCKKVPGHSLYFSELYWTIQRIEHFTFLGRPGLQDSLEELEATEPADICRGLLPDRLDSCETHHGHDKYFREGLKNSS